MVQAKGSFLKNVICGGGHRGMRFEERTRKGSEQNSRTEIGGKCPRSQRFRKLANRVTSPGNQSRFMTDDV